MTLAHSIGSGTKYWWTGQVFFNKIDLLIAQVVSCFKDFNRQLKSARANCDHARVHTAVSG